MIGNSGPTSAELAEMVKAGIRAVTNGRPEEARDVLESVVEADPDNETAWWWLSQVAETAADRHMCLRNVLQLNPAHAEARRRLGALTDEVEQRQRPSVSPAAAILYPERQADEWFWQDDIELQQAPSPETVSLSGFDDVWERETDICAFCAHEVGLEDKRCGQCGRKLLKSVYRYERPSPNLYIYFVLILGVSQMAVALVMFGVLTGASPVLLMWNTLLAAGMGILAVGIYFRRFWAYTGSLIVSLMAFSVIGLDLASGGAMQAAVPLSELGLVELLQIDMVDALRPLVDLLPPLQAVALVLALLYGAFIVGPDFERSYRRLLAKLDKDADDASAFFIRGRRYAEQAMWASAVLHWRRAVAREPYRAQYQEMLAQGYARLGFLERSLDMLRSARLAAQQDDRRQRLDNWIAEVEALVASAPTRES